MYDSLRENLLDKYEAWGQDIRDEDVMDLCISDIRNLIDDSKEFKLYRYVSPDYFNIRNIETQQIHLSPNGVLNDVYEGLVVDKEKANYQKFQELKELAYMTCLTESNENILMWSHYAKGHTGICIEYDLKTLVNDKYQILNHIFPVIYDNDIILERNIPKMIEIYKSIKTAIDIDEALDGKLFNDIIPLFLIKSKVWEYEREWRVIYSLKQMYDKNDKILYSGNIPFNCISGIYLGIKIHPEIKRNILEICERISNDDKHIDVYQAKISGDRYKIEFDKVQ